MTMRWKRARKVDFVRLRRKVSLMLGIWYTTDGSRSPVSIITSGNVVRKSPAGDVVRSASRKRRRVTRSSGEKKRRPLPIIESNTVHVRRKAVSYLLVKPLSPFKQKRTTPNPTQVQTVGVTPARHAIYD